MRPIVIAHRGASGYLPEHTLAAKALAHEMGADYLEQDLVVSRDDELIVLHDIYLDRVTDVAEQFPDRARGDGRFYVRDFDLWELRLLKVWERMNAAGEPVYPQRYPARSGEFRLNTLGEEIALTQSLNAESGRQVGIYPEIKRPAWHREEGADPAPQLLEVLTDFGYKNRDDPVFVQCFDDAELRRLRHELNCPFRLVQLIGDNAWHEADTDYNRMITAQGISRLAETADAIGPGIFHLYELRDSLPQPTELTEFAHDANLLVHPYTFRDDDLPPGFVGFDELVRFFADEIGVDGLFTDFPDLALKVLNDRT